MLHLYLQLHQRLLAVLVVRQKFHLSSDHIVLSVQVDLYDSIIENSISFNVQNHLVEISTLNTRQSWVAIFTNITLYSIRTISSSIARCTLPSFLTRTT